MGIAVGGEQIRGGRPVILFKGTVLITQPLLTQSAKVMGFSFLPKWHPTGLMGQWANEPFSPWEIIFHGVHCSET